MACVSPDGKPTKSGLKILSALENKTLSSQEISSITSLPLFRVRSGLRELINAGFVAEKEGNFLLTERGSSFIKE